MKRLLFLLAAAVLCAQPAFAAVPAPGTGPEKAVGRPLTADEIKTLVARPASEALPQLLNAADLAKAERLDGTLKDLLGGYLSGGRKPLATGSFRLGGLTPYDSVFFVKDNSPIVDITVFGDAEAIAAELKKLPGVQVLGVATTPAYGLISAAVPLDQLLTLGGIAGVRQASASGALTGRYDPPSDPLTAAIEGASAPRLLSEGVANDQAEQALDVDDMRRVFPTIDGSGIKVGTLSDSVNRRMGPGALVGIAASQATGDLPPGARATFIDDYTGSDATDEGRGMMEHIYDLCPGISKLTFGSAFNGQGTFATNILTLRLLGMDIVNDDVVYYDEPYYQDGVVANAVNGVVGLGGTYFALNHNFGDRSYESGWANSDLDEFHDFVTGGSDPREVMRVTLAGGKKCTVGLQWNQPWGAASTNLSLELWDSTLTNRLAFTSTGNVGGAPCDILSYTNSGGDRTAYLAVKWISGPGGFTLKFIGFGGLTFDEYANRAAGTLTPHAGTPLSIAIGTANWTNRDTTTGYSGRGPFRQFFNPSGGFIGSHIYDKPDFIGIDGCNTSFFGGDIAQDADALPNFFGTSAATPHIAAVGALMLEAAGGPGSLSRNDFHRLLRMTAVDLGPAGWERVNGYGRPSALGAVTAARGPLSPEYYLYPNLSGFDSMTQNFYSDADIDSFRFASDVSGTCLVRIDDTGPANPLIALFNDDTDEFLAIKYGTAGSPVQLAFTASAGTRYLVEVLSQDPFAGSSNYTFSVNGPDAGATTLGLNTFGHASSNSSLYDNSDIDYFRVTAPNTLTGGMHVTVDPTGFDGLIILYDSDGNELSRAGSGSGVGVEDDLAYGYGLPLYSGLSSGGGINRAFDFPIVLFTGTSISPGDQFTIAVCPYRYINEGSYRLDVQFDCVAGQPQTLASLPSTVSYIVRPNPVSGLFSAPLRLISTGQVDTSLWVPDTPHMKTLTVPIIDVQDLLSVGLYNMAKHRLDYGGPGGVAGIDYGSGVVGTQYFHRVYGAFDHYSFPIFLTPIFSLTSATESPAPKDLIPEMSLTVSPGMAKGDEYGSIWPTGDNDYFKFTTPADSDGTIQVVLEVTSVLDGKITLFSPTGSVLSAANSLPSYGDETINFNGALPGQTYYVLAQGAGEMNVALADVAQRGTYWLHVSMGRIVPSPTPTVSLTPSPSPTPSLTPSISPTAPPTASPTASSTPTASPSASPTPSPTATPGPCSNRTAISDAVGSSTLDTIDDPNFPLASCAVGAAAPNQVALWCFEVPAPGGQIQFTARSADGTVGTLFLSFRNCCLDAGSEVSCTSGAATRGVSQSFANLAPGFYTAVVESVVAMPVTLSWTGQVPLIANCKDQCTYDPCADRTTVGGTSGSDPTKTRRPTEPYAPSSCAPSEAPSVAAFCFSLNAPANINFTAEWLEMTFGGTMAMSIRTCCDNPLSELICMSGSSTSPISFSPNLAAGAYTVIVETDQPAEIDLSWASNATLIDLCGDDCAPTPTATPRPTFSITPSPTASLTPRPTNSVTPTASATPTPSASSTPTASPTPLDPCLQRRIIWGQNGEDNQKTYNNFSFVKSSCSTREMTSVALWCFTIAPPGGQATLRARSAEGIDVPMILSVRRCCFDASTELACIAGPSANGVVLNLGATAPLPPGTYVVVVETAKDMDIILEWVGDFAATEICPDNCDPLPTPSVSPVTTPSPSETPRPTETVTPTPPILCPDNSIFSQPANFVANGEPPRHAVDSNTASGNLAYENFHGLNNPICDLHWWGIVSDTQFTKPCDTPQAFRITFYADNNGLPGAVVSGPHNVTPAMQPAGTVIGLPAWRFDVEFDKCIDLESGWVSIQCVNSPTQGGCNFYWLTTAPGDGYSVTRDAAGNIVGEHVDLSLCLTTRFITPTATPRPTPAPVNVCDHRVPITGKYGFDSQSTVLDPNLSQGQCFITGASYASGWCFEIPNPGGFIQLTSYLPPTSQQPVILSLRRCCNNAATEIDCANGSANGASLTFEFLPPGYYTAIAETTSSTTLTLRWNSATELQPVCVDLCGTTPTPTATPFNTFLPTPSLTPSPSPTATPTETPCLKPYEPSGPYPADGAIGIPIAAILSWQSMGDPGGPAVDSFFDVFFEIELTTGKPSRILCSNLSDNTCDPGPLVPGRTYFWQVVARNPCGETPGPIWSFTTELLPTPEPTSTPGPTPSVSPTSQFSPTPTTPPTPPATGPCGHRVAIAGASGNSVLNTIDAPGFPQPSCYLAGADNLALWCFEVPAPGGLVRLAATAAAGDVPNPIVLSLRRCCDDPSTEVGCATDSPFAAVANLDFDFLPPGHYTAIAQTIEPTNITLTWSCQVALLPNCSDQCSYDPCQSRVSIGGLKGTRENEARVPTTEYPSSTCFPATAKPAVAAWCFLVEQTATVTLEVGWNVDLDELVALSVRRCCDDPYTEAACVIGSSTRGTSLTLTLEPGPYTVVVETLRPATLLLSWDATTPLISQCYDICRETPTPTATPAPTKTQGATPSPTLTPTRTPGPTQPPTPTATRTPLPTLTPGPTKTPGSTKTPVPTLTPQPTAGYPLDTDQDGFSDDYERAHGSDPNDPGSVPLVLDLTGDGQVDESDATLFYGYLIGTAAAVPAGDLSAFDFNGDGRVDVADALLFYRNRRGIIPVIPVP